MNSARAFRFSDNRRSTPASRQTGEDRGEDYQEYKHSNFFDSRSRRLTRMFGTESDTMQSALTINGGSSSIKFALYHVEEPLKRGLYGKIDRIGLRIPQR